MKNIIIALLLVLGTVNAQEFNKRSIEGSIGRNIYADRLGNSRGDILANIGYRHMLTETFGLQSFYQFDKINSQQQLSHPECEYSAISNSFRIELFKRLARFNRFTVNGTAGLGGTFYREDAGYKQTVLNYTAAGNIFYALGKKANPWGAAKLEYRGIANSIQKNTLNNNFRTTSNPIQAFKQDVSLGLVYYLGKKKDKLHADWFVGDDCIECITEVVQPITVTPTSIQKEMVIPYEVVLFDEGSDELNTDAQRASIIKMVEFLDRHPDVRIEVVGAACGGKGSPERNLELSVNRAKAVYDKMGSLRNDDYSRLSYRGTGVDTKYRHQDQDVQKRVNFIIYK